jgi:RNA polymerase sigma-70 factor (ECF subfamily)
VAQGEAVQAALAWFVELPAAQRSAVILKDVLDHSLDQIAELLDLSVPAVKAALHRGRLHLRDLQARAAGEPAPVRRSSPVVARYASLFNARDWDGVRALLAEDVELEVVDRVQRKGRSAVDTYFTQYERLAGWRVAPAWLDGREVLAVFEGGAQPASLIELDRSGDCIARIRDFRHVPYIARDARFDPPAPA